MKLSRKKMTAAITAAVLLITLVIGGTLAYFTDEAEVKNTFTAGNVEIKLDEAVFDKTLVTDEKTGKITSGYDPVQNEYFTKEGRTDEGNTYEPAITPGAVIHKDPIVENTGSEDAYIAVVIEINNPLTPLVVKPEGYIGLTEMMDGGLANTSTFNWTTSNEKYGAKYAWQAVEKGKDKPCVILTQNPIEKEGKVTGHRCVYYFQKPFVQYQKQALFETLTIDNKWDNDEMESLGSLEMDIKAYAVQAKGFTDVYTAMNAGFKDVFPTITAS